MVRAEGLLTPRERHSNWACRLAAIVGSVAPAAVAGMLLIIAICDLVSHPG